MGTDYFDVGVFDSINSVVPHIRKSRNDRDLIYYALFRCVPCKKLTLQTFRFSQNEYDPNENLSAAGWQQKFPGDEITYASKFEGTVPREILEDFAEGVIIFA